MAYDVTRVRFISKVLPYELGSKRTLFDLIKRLNHVPRMENYFQSYSTKEKNHFIQPRIIFPHFTIKVNFYPGMRRHQRDAKHTKTYSWIHTSLMNFQLCTINLPTYLSIKGKSASPLRRARNLNASHRKKWSWEGKRKKRATEVVEWRVLEIKRKHYLRRSRFSSRLNEYT